MNVQSNVAVVIPAFNEKATLRWVVQRVLAHASLVIVVDDGSTDGTADVVADLPVILLRNERNEGKAASLWRGAHEALRRHAEAVCTIDGDAQHDPDDMPRLMAAYRNSPASIVIGSRLHSIAAIPRARYRANRIANFWIGWAAGYRIADSQSGFRVYPAWLFQSARVRHDRRASFVFESEILIEAARLGVRATCVPISVTYANLCRASHFRPVVDIARIVRMVALRLLGRTLCLPGLLRSLDIGRADRGRSVSDPPVRQREES
ncbi:MAG: glycosyltransferase family 2 protein [Casimicrobiaceae bacterium]